jgi:VanZ family protein
VTWVKLGRIAVAIVAPTILVLSLLPDVAGPLGETVGDKIPHLIAYATLGFFVYVATGRAGVAVLVVSVVLCTLYGGAIEILQQYTGRTPEIGDWVADFAGALGGSLAAAGCRRYLLGRRADQPDR